MLHPDPRAYRVALLADAVANEGIAGFDALGMLDAADFGVVVLPPADFVIGTIAGIVEYAVDDLADYRRSGYRVVVVGSSAVVQFGVWSGLVDAEMLRRGLAEFERFDVSGASRDDFAAFLGATTPPALIVATAGGV